MRSRLNHFAFFSLLSIVLFFGSCQKESLVPEDGQKLSFRDPQSFTYSLDSAGVGDSVLITFDLGNGADCGHVQFQVTGPNGGGFHGGQPITPDSGIATLLFVPDVPGEYTVKAKYTRTGKPSDCDYESTGWLIAPDPLIVGGGEEEEDDTDSDSTDVDSMVCESSFTGEVLNCDSTSRQVLFTFVADEDVEHLKIKGGLTNGVEGEVEVTVEGADLDITQKTPGHSSNRVITLEGSAVACDTIFITLSWTSNNSGAEITGEWSGYGLTVDELECE